MRTSSLHGIAKLSIGFVHPLFGSFSVNISVSLPELGLDDKQLLVIYWNSEPSMMMTTTLVLVVLVVVIPTTPSRKLLTKNAHQPTTQAQ